MQFRGDRRGQAIQIGAVLLLGAIVLSFAIYQSTVVPEQNREIEFQHSQTVGDQLQDVRNGIVSTGSTGDGRSVSVTLGTQYPSRVIAMNPAPPSGTLATVGTTDRSINATIANAEATGETADFWNGTNRTYNTGSLVYRSGYNEYRNAPTTWYENSVLFDEFRDANLTETGQRLIDGTTISLVALNGSYRASRTGSVSLDFRGTSVSSRTVSVTNETGSNVTITVPTRLDEQNWEELLADEPHFVDARPVSVAGADYHLMQIVLERGVTYDLRLSRAGLGTNVVKPEPAYLTRVAENTPTVPEGGKVDVTVEVRDRFDNPKRDVEVIAGTNESESSVSPNSHTSDGDGQVTVTYEAPSISGESQLTDHVQLSLNTSLSSAVNGSEFNGSTPVNVSVPIRVDNSDGSGLGGGGGGAYDTTWKDPSGQTGVSGSNGVYTVDASETSSVTLTGETAPVAENASMEFTLNDSSVGSLSPTTTRTDSNGEATTTFTPQSNGSITVFVSSGGSGDRLNLDVIGVGGGGSGKNQIQFVTGTGSKSGDSNSNVSFTVENLGSTDVTVKNITVDNVDSNNIANIGNGDKDDLYLPEFQSDRNGSLLNVNTAFDIGSTEKLDTQDTVPAKSQTTYTIGEFRNNGDNEKDPGNSVTVTLGFTDGTERTLTIPL
ncbi:putative surface protein, possible component of pili like system [Halapricum desulfuricans]|uniref:Putative surface protein, possible component of pili like system n=1 Tax=Halapricum desulfuricans TaxID=2841257 RepID=A0A897NH49_9EURY|nr:hypothetical protein [Halapricum desulfuricans]QSG11918.1 putative surface protein, possible component of pili like system [Halapricum desulfuricans]